MTPREKIDQEVYLLVRGRLGDRASEEDVAMLTDLTCSAIDAATKSLQEEIGHLELYRDELLARWKASEARNKALVEALDILTQSSAWESLEASIPSMTPDERRAVAIILLTLNAEEDKESLPKASDGA